MDKYVILFSNGSKLFIKADIARSSNDAIEFFSYDEDTNERFVGRFFKMNIAGYFKFENVIIEK